MSLLASIWDDFRHALRSGNMVTRLMLLNFSVFIGVSLLYVALWAGMPDDTYYDALWSTLDHFCLPADLRELLYQPWTPITSIFLHQNFWHFLVNMIWLYLFGSAVRYLIGDRNVFPIYLLGGLAGGATFLISSHFFTYVGAYALGASAAVMALAGAAVLLNPDYRIMLIMLGEVKVKYIVLVMVLLDLIGFADKENLGGHAAHIGGFLMGCFFVYRLRDGHFMAAPINRVIDRVSGLFSEKNRGSLAESGAKQTVVRPPEKSSRAHQRSDVEDLSHQEKMDRILDKIKAQGLESLTQEEKDFLFQASKK